MHQMSNGDCKMKYQLIYREFINRWDVMKNGKCIRWFVHKEDAQDYVQGCIEDDNWNAANR